MSLICGGRSKAVQQARGKWTTSDPPVEAQLKEARMSPERQDVTRLLQQWKGGDHEALDQLMPIVYDELRRLSARCLRSERPGHTLRATALVHEAYIRLMDADVGWQNRAHFYAVAARVVRRILVEYARTHSRQKRGGGEEPIPLDDAVAGGAAGRLDRPGLGRGPATPGGLGPAQE